MFGNPTARIYVIFARSANIILMPAPARTTLTHLNWSAKVALTTSLFAFGIANHIKIKQQVQADTVDAREQDTRAFNDFLGGRA